MEGATMRNGTCYCSPCRLAWCCIVLGCALLLAAQPAQAGGGSGSADDVEATCPLPPTRTGPNAFAGKPRIALASHPRSGSTWMRFLLERATGLPCGFEAPDWANVLPHYGDDPEFPEQPNKNGLVIKTHSSCFGCWTGAEMIERHTLKLNASVTRADVAKVMGKKYAKRLEKLGCCLLAAPKRFEAMVNRVVQAGPGKPKHGPLLRMADHLPCDNAYDGAVLLFRHPVDVVRSNYHYRTAVLGMRDRGSWERDDYSFPRERGLSWAEFYRSWTEFAKHKPVLHVLYEDLKANTSREIRRILDFLNITGVGDEKVECAINASTIDKLREFDSFARRSTGPQRETNFFGTRSSTESKEKLSYPDSLLRDFDQAGVFEISHNKLGYPRSPEELRMLGGSPADSKRDEL